MMILFEHLADDAVRCMRTSVKVKKKDKCSNVTSIVSEL